MNTSSNGAAIFAQLFLEWCADRKIEVDVISSEKSDPKFIPLVRQNRIFSRFPILNQYHRSFIYYKTVKEQLQNNSYDLIFFNSVVESLHSAKLITAVPVHAFLHDENFMNDYIERPSLKRKTYRNIMFRHEQKACVYLDKIWTNSKYMKLSIDSIYGLHPIKSSFFYFRPFDLESNQENSNDGTIRILFIKHDYTRGGLIPLIQGINEIKNYSIVLDVIGPPESKHAGLKKFLHNHTMEITEYKNRVDIQQSFQQANIFCVPSYSEALGLGNLEALSLGVPVITSNIPVMNELNKHNVFHILPSHKPADIKRVIVLIIEDKELQGKYRNNGLEFINSQLNKETVFQSFDEILIS